jgi:hypothetical protein
MAFLRSLHLLDSKNVAASLSHAANGRFKAMISCDPAPAFGREGTVRLSHVATDAACHSTRLGTCGARKAEARKASTSVRMSSVI